MRDRLMRIWPRGHCHLRLSRDGVSVLRVSGSRKGAPVVVERPMPMLADATPDALAAPIAAALEAAGGTRLPVHATIDDDLARYFIVTPPANGARMHDLRAAAGVRFQLLYGESLANWQLAADWHAAKPFLACAVPQRVHAALRLAVDAQRGCLASVTPIFVAAWNRSRRRLDNDAWVATLGDSALTLGLVAGAGAKARRLSAVRTLSLPDRTAPVTWLRDQLARAALLDNVPPPSALHIHGAPRDDWHKDAAGLNVHWHPTREGGTTR
ncbi:hypothetical protein [Burkholderia sp. Ac-20365]|uniref:hypothetical protein n=1 Tax=Burkholderia sp. Ac-20365 TaxID=2703897 RepID=UPI00197C6BF6|nr:hypothetical protein [Burkholderia sp. Ac-20365]MBN3766588.1 hypothetical protein [Burkholderia sp. Ac-20365]